MSPASLVKQRKPSDIDVASHCAPKPLPRMKFFFFGFPRFVIGVCIISYVAYQHNSKAR
jgi:hypothetical protein